MHRLCQLKQKDKSEVARKALALGLTMLETKEAF